MYVLSVGTLARRGAARRGADGRGGGQSAMLKVGEKGFHLAESYKLERNAPVHPEEGQMLSSKVMCQCQKSCPACKLDRSRSPRSELTYVVRTHVCCTVCRSHNISSNTML